jgi:hypothetical protein
LTSYLGAPTWFITFAPADVHHPIALYYADTKQTYWPNMPSKNVRKRLIANNPVAGARFFEFMVDMFIQYVLVNGSNHNGFYGKTSGYYGTVERQGRLTLHMHMMIWIKHSLTPQELREKIMNPESDFQKRLVEYLESRDVGEFVTGTMSSVSDYWTPVQETHPQAYTTYRDFISVT